MATSSSSQSGDSNSEEDTSSSDEQESELTSWGKIYKSLALVPASSHTKDKHYTFIFNIANEAVNHGHLVNALKLYSLGLSHFYQKCAEKGDSKKYGGKDGRGRRIPFNKRLLRYALEGCSENKNALACKRFRFRLVKVIDVILECCDLLELMDCWLLQSIASLYFSLKEKHKSFHLSARAIQMNPKSLSIQEMFENICCHLVERWHFVMLNDKGRNYAYQQAIEASLRRIEMKAIVCDVGCGTGILSVIACQQQNSAKIFAIEKSASMCDVASSVFSANLDPTATEKIILVNKMSSKMSVPQDMPHKADVLVTETFDAGLFGEGILPTLCHAWANLLKNSEQEKGLVIPGRAQLYLQAVECDAILKESRFHGQFEGLTTSHIHICGSTGLCESEPYAAHDLSHLPGGYRTLSEPVQFLDVNFNDCQELNSLNKGIIQETMVEITCNGRLDAIAVWFSLHLDDSTVISTHMGSHSCWEQAVFSVHAVKIKVHPKSRGPVFDMNVQPRDTLKVVHAVVGAKLSMDVAAVCSPDEDSVCSSIIIPQFLNDADVLWKHSIYCLTPQEVKVLNNTTLHSTQYQQMLELFALVKKDNSEIDFIHLNDAYSPLCLQALNLGFHQSIVSIRGQYHAALLQKMATLNNIDMSKLRLLEDVCCLEHPRPRESENWSNGASGFNTGLLDKAQVSFMQTSDVHQIEESSAKSGDYPVQSCASRERGAVVLCDLVDAHGRLVEGLQGQEEALRYQLSKYRTVAVAPNSLDVYGVLIDSEQLLRLSRVQSDENTLGFNIASFVNQYATRNHQDISLAALPHTKLTEPFKMFTINICKMFNLPEPTNTAAEQTLTSKKPNKIKIPEEKLDKTFSCFSEEEANNKLCAPLSQPHSNYGSILPEYKIVPEFNSSSTTPVPAGESNSTKQLVISPEFGFQAQEICLNNSYHQVSSGCENEKKHSEVKSQGNISQNTTSQSNTSQSTISQSTILDPVPIESIQSDLGSVEELSSKRLSFNKEQKGSNRLDRGVKNKQCSPESNFLRTDGADWNGESSSGIKRRRLSDADGDYDAFPEYDLNEEDGELVQSVHLKVPVIAPGSVTAMVYWFELHFTPTCSISTVDPTHHWHQAAVMTLLSQNQYVTTGDVLNLFCQINGSAISFMIE